MRIVVLGGGYAGLACLARLARVLPDAERHLVDPGRWHLRRTLLHETLRKPLSELRAEFRADRARWAFATTAARGRLVRERLAEWSETRRLPVGRANSAFDALVVTTGLPGQDGQVSRSRTRRCRWSAGHRSGRQCATSAWRRRGTRVGGRRRRQRPAVPVRARRGAARGAPLGLIEAGDTSCPPSRTALRREVLARLEARRRPPARHALLGLRPRPRAHDGPAARVRAGRRGAAVHRADGAADRGRCGRSSAVRGRPLPGSCRRRLCRWTGVPFDAATAQTAVRKGRHVAETIARIAAGREPAEVGRASSSASSSAWGPAMPSAGCSRARR
jgi:NADH:ubiquinone reductase (H+-translocating)